MTVMARLTYLLAALACIGTSFAQISFRPADADDVRYEWTVPDDGRSEDLYLRMSAPDVYSWFALGIGTQMKGARIILIYQDGDGNVTLSTRIGRHHEMPLYQRRPDVQLLEGSGVSDGRMTAIIRCSDCQALSSVSGNRWVAAWLRGEAINAAEPNAVITFHEGKVRFEVDLSQAGIYMEGNPFLGPDNSNDGAGTDKAITLVDEAAKPSEGYLIAHGVIMTIVFVVLYPLGALLMPLLRRWYLHSTSQLIAYGFMWIGVVLGVLRGQQVGYIGTTAHTCIGLVVISLLAFQPILGWLHHRNFSNQQADNAIRRIHVWGGRALMMMGIVNGGLGLQLAGNIHGAWVIVYCALAACSGGAYIGLLIYSVARKRKREAVSQDITSSTRVDDNVKDPFGNFQMLSEQMTRSPPKIYELQ
ncbi:hypothetical protein B0I35DRAFT_398837 [Stachybotrys elegans]|uniref:DOMON domain-containing protein n=1 Tax=Stachybotrys elegans TaxID=80388 RepID=A0A8K0SCT5_9HYPO|nr:hypothetical protein B0I35DRAFT_398837 [Stachybotrys elegans]